jgi:DNA-binding NarL/FixJ family response regulator
MLMSPVSPTPELAKLPNVLVLEDEDLMSALILKYLSMVPESIHAPIRVQALPSGWDLLTRDLGHIDVAVVDILLPRVTGIDIIRDFRKRFPRMGIVPISGMATEPMKRTLRELVPESPVLIPKPLRREEFVEAFVRAWRTSRTAPETTRHSIQPLPTAPDPAKETDEEKLWSAGLSQTHNPPVIERRLSRRKVA